MLSGVDDCLLVYLIQKEGWKKISSTDNFDLFDTYMKKDADVNVNINK